MGTHRKKLSLSGIAKEALSERTSDLGFEGCTGVHLAKSRVKGISDEESSCSHK